MDNRRKLSDMQVSQLQALHQMRIPSSQIASHFDVSVGTVRHHTLHQMLPKFTLASVLEVLEASEVPELRQTFNVHEAIAA